MSTGAVSKGNCRRALVGRRPLLPSQLKRTAPAIRSIGQDVVIEDKKSVSEGSISQEAFAGLSLIVRFLDGAKEAMAAGLRRVKADVQSVDAAVLFFPERKETRS